MTTYDYIIVGAGSAGCVLARDLSEDATKRVLLVEEGGTGDGMLVTMPKGFGKLLTDPATAHFIPTARQRPGGVPEFWVRGKMLGGSSGVNGMVYNRGIPADYNRLAELAGEEWNWASMDPMFRSIEGKPDGSGGPLTITTNPRKSPLTDALIEAGTQTGLPVKTDHGELQQIGIGRLQWNIDARGKRISAARAFLADAMKRPNLDVVTGMRADKVLMDGRRAVGITGEHNGSPAEFSAREVILAAGAIGSPRLLQMSGIGPADVLSAAGVPLVHESPEVGRNMREHILLMQHFRLKRMADSDNNQFSGLRLVANVLKHLVLGSGPMSYGSSDAVAFANLFDPSGRADSQIMFAPYSLDMDRNMAMEAEPGMQFYGMTLRPRSKGSIAIVSADPEVPVTIQPNYLADEYDREAAVAQFRFVRKLVSQPALQPFVVSETALTAAASSDEDILALLHQYGQSGYHAVGTVRMGTGEECPLDPHLRLRGVKGLRVVDCSAFPEMIAGNTNGPVMALARRSAQLIREEAAA